MIDRLFSRLNLDVLGIGTSVLCAVHCALLPLLISALPLLGLHFTGHGLLEYCLLSVSFLAGCLALGRGFWYRHRWVLPLLLFGIGFVCLVAGHFIPLFHAYEGWIIALGAGLLVAAHWLNIRHTHPKVPSSAATAN
ncbi:MerC mercury resistance protein [Chitinophaga jiangningensis]|uniref:MerC mercury resistance protein n=1 Tax=Chitinophaga jiangningensis TaxID=1419482 RepID=A0A1M7E4B8_9BACT|nr:MerC domain-containing protein [Chitinophaga jiangningensis]SHL86540.1 MerC mercury resistance protein [Chitinophaga jiangningensis]